VQEAFQKWFPGVEGHREECIRHKKEFINCEVRADVAQARGNLAKAVAYISLQAGKVIETVEDGIAMAIELLQDQGGEFLNSVMDKTNQIIAQNNLGLNYVEPMEWQSGQDFGAEIIDFNYCNWPGRSFQKHLGFE
jgi:hypothetical protein